MLDPSADAAAQLRAIRSLMERATVYRAVSAPAALIAGALALALGLWQHFDNGYPLTRFFAHWLTVLGLAAGINLWLLHRSAGRRGETFVSCGMKHAFLALAPPLAAGLVVSLWVLQQLPLSDHPAAIANWMTVCWVTFYGLGLLAAGSFSPASMRALGWIFTAAGLLLFVFWNSWAGRAGGVSPAPLVMAATFGLFHIIYGLTVLLRRLPVRTTALPEE